MFPKLVLLFTVVPAVEIYFLIQVGAWIGGMNTLLLIIATGVVGAHYARQQGFEVVMRIQRAMNEGRPPANEMVDGAMLLVGGALLMTPGLITDAVGFSLVFPPTRAVIKEWFLGWLKRNIKSGDITIHRY